MAGITLQQATDALNAWIAADAALAGGAQSYTVDIAGSRTQVTKADAEQIRSNIDYWQRWCVRLGRTSGLPVREVIPR